MGQQQQQINAGRHGNKTTVGWNSVQEIENVCPVYNSKCEDEMGNGR